MVLLLSSVIYSYPKITKYLLRTNFHSSCIVMAKSKFEYVRSFEIEDKLEPAQWIAINLKFVDSEKFEYSEKYVVNNDSNLKIQNAMTDAAKKVIVQIQDLKLCYVYGNKCNFIISKHSNFYKRRGFKLLTSITSSFCSTFVANWNFLLDDPLELSLLPIFEGCIYLFPQDQFLRDYLTFCQHKCHLRNLYITTLRNLIYIGKLDYKLAIEKVNKSNEGEKNEMLFSLCNINYNNENEESKKGKIFFYESVNVKNEVSHVSPIKKLKRQVRNSRNLVETCDDFCKDSFWKTNIKLEEATSHKCKYKILSSFKKSTPIILHSWIVVRLDGISFHKFSEKHKFKKPNDLRSLQLMNSCANIVMTKYPAIILGYGQSDEYSFVIRRYKHGEKEGHSLISRIVSLFSGAFVNLWCTRFPDSPLEYHPSFDARLVIYPTNSSLRDYLSWRQADCHINNMYNTCFWNLVTVRDKVGKNIEEIKFEAQESLKGTYSKDKLNILKEMNIIYDLEEPIYRKGTVIYIPEQNGVIKDDKIIEDHCDIINDEFWDQRKWLLGDEWNPMSSASQLLDGPQAIS